MKVFSAILVVTFLGVAHGQGERRRVRVRGRARPAAGRAIARPAPQQPPINELSCPEPEGLQVYPDPTSCNRFYKCANGTLTNEICENGLLFDTGKALAGAVHNHCSYNWNTNCGEREADNTPIQSAAGCPYQFGEYPVAPDVCEPSYVKCAFGTPTQIPCESGLVYDPDVHTCNWPDQLVEKLGCDPSGLLGGFVCPDQSQLTPLEARFFPFPRFPVQGRDDLYIICVDGLPRLQSCGAGLFDPSTLGCIEEF